MPLQVYYAHAMCLYGTALEKAEMLAIAAHLPGCEIVNPRTLQRDGGKDEGKDEGMEYWFGLIDGCDALVFSRLLNTVTAGVGLEVNHALTRPIPVHELYHGNMVKVATPVQFLTREETLKHFEFWRTVTDPKLESIWMEGCLLSIRKV
ncbi:MAG: hypothetical protein OK474_00440 [Thaumarchaeota archaeon]|nr:hypothetical protein [Nitrososphaerota archaeon]